MNRFNISISSVRNIGLGIMVILIAMMILTGIYYISSMESGINTIQNVYRVQLNNIDDLHSEFVDIRAQLSNFVVEEQDDLAPVLDKTTKLIEKAESFRSSLDQEKNIVLMEQFLRKLKQYMGLTRVLG